MAAEIASDELELDSLKHGKWGVAEAYQRVGGADTLGSPISEFFEAGDGVVVQFTNGKIYASASVGAHMVKGAILASYEALGGPTGRLGFPTSDETIIGNPENPDGGWASEFENGRIQCLNNGKGFTDITITETALAPGRTFSYRNSYADHGVVYQVFVGQEYNLTRLRRFDEIQHFYQTCDAPLIIDCGANIGASAVWFSEVFPRAEIIAIEPDAGNFHLLEQNTAGLNVRPILGAVAGESGVLQLVDPGEGEWGYRSIGSGRALGEVRAYSISELLSLRTDLVPFILKVDIEGAEGDLFGPQDAEFYARFPLVVIELHDWMLPRGGTSRPFLEWHLGSDRDFVYHGENVFSMCNRQLLSSALR